MNIDHGSENTWRWNNNGLIFCRDEDLKELVKERTGRLRLYLFKMVMSVFVLRSIESGWIHNAQLRKQRKRRWVASCDSSLGWRRLRHPNKTRVRPWSATEFPSTPLSRRTLVRNCFTELLFYMHVFDRIDAAKINSIIISSHSKSIWTFASTFVQAGLAIIGNCLFNIKKRRIFVWNS